MTETPARTLPQENLDALAELLVEVDERIAAEDAAQASTG